MMPPTYTMREQNQLLAVCFELEAVTKTENRGRSGATCGLRRGLRQAQSIQWDTEERLATDDAQA
jgi:hypothetical protein